MTDEERRQKLVANLYSLSRDDDRATLCYDAADEIERLAALAQSNAEPVAWKIERLQVALGKIASICRDYSIATDSSAQIKENAAVRTSSRDVSTGK